MVGRQWLFTSFSVWTSFFRSLCHKTGLIALVENNHSLKTITINTMRSSWRACPT